MSNNLKALTKEHHDNAERTEFADMLLGGNIPPRLYQQYLHAQLANYSALESVVEVPMELESIFRSTQIEEDLVELEVPRGPTTKFLPFADDVETSPWPSASEPKPTMISPASFVT